MGAADAFVTKNGWSNRVQDRGVFFMTFGDGKTQKFPNRQIELSIWVDDMSEYKAIFQVCRIPNGCDIMLGVPWKRVMKPIGKPTVSIVGPKWLRPS